MTALELRFDSLAASSTIDTSAAHDTCPSEKVHLHFHGGEEDVDHGSPDDTYIHVKLDVEDHHDYHGHGGHRRFHDPEGTCSHYTLNRNRNATLFQCKVHEVLLKVLETMSLRVIKK